MTVYYPQSSVFLVLQLVGMSRKNNEREKKRGGPGKRQGVSSLSLFFLFVYLFVCFALVFLFARPHLPRV